MYKGKGGNLFYEQEKNILNYNNNYFDNNFSNNNFKKYD